MKSPVRSVELIIVKSMEDGGFLAIETAEGVRGIRNRQFFQISYSPSFWIDYFRIFSTTLFFSLFFFLVFENLVFRFTQPATGCLSRLFTGLYGIN
jgi:hypothetical protein